VTVLKHPIDVQILKCNEIGGIYELSGYLMQELIPMVLDLLVELGNFALCFQSIGRALLFSG